MEIDSLGPETRVAVLGLGYVGLPLAHVIARFYDTIGFDIDAERVREINQGVDRNLALQPDDLKSERRINYSSENDSLAGARIYIITAPTPVDAQNQPNLSPVLHATKLVAQHLKPGCIVVFESTVYPGATEEECVPVLEKFSGLKFNQDFFVGYSP